MKNEVKNNGWAKKQGESMKNKVKSNGWAIGSIISVCLSITGNAFAAGTWAGDVSGDWSNSANWVDGIIANGANNSAIFDNDRTQAVTVTADSDRTIGKLTFNKAGAGQIVTIDGPGVLTMVTTPGTTPKVTVFEPSVNISAALAGNMGVDFLSSGGGWATLSGNNTFTGGSRISAMGLTLANAGGLSLNGDIRFENNGRTILAESEQIADTAIVAWADDHSGHFELGGKNETIGGFQSNSGSGSRWIENGFITSSPGPATVTIDTAAGQIYNWNGIVRGDTGSGLSIVKTGAGTQVFSGGTSYARGTVSVEEGTLILNNANLFSDALTVSAGAILGGNGNTDGDVSIEANGFLAPGDDGIGIFTLNGSDLTLEDGAGMTIELTSSDTAGTTYDQIVGANLILSGGVNLVLEGTGTQNINLNDSFVLFDGAVSGYNSANFNIINNTDWTQGWSQSVQGDSLVLTAIPEPTTFGLMLAIPGLAILLRRVFSL